MTYMAHAGPLWVRALIVGSAMLAWSGGLLLLLAQGQAPNATSQTFATLASLGFAAAGVAAIAWSLHLQRTDPTRRV